MLSIQIQEQISHKMGTVNSNSCLRMSKEASQQLKIKMVAILVLIKKINDLCSAIVMIEEDKKTPVH